MGEWKEYRFSDFVCINPTVKLPKENISFVEMKDLNESTRYCMPSQERPLSGGSRFEEGDTLFARITPCLENGKICQVKGLKNRKGFGSTEFYVFRGKKNLSDTDFVYYLSRWEEVRNHAEKNMDGTSGRQRVPKEAFSDLYLSLPEMSIQKNIVSILSVLDDKINLLHLQNTTLEKMAETIYRQWFIEEAKEDWKDGTLGDIIDLNYGKSLKEELRTGKGYPVVGSSGIVGYHSEYLVERPGIVIGRKGTLGVVVYLKDNFFPIDTTYYVTPKESSLLPYYNYCLLKSINFEELNSDSAVPGLNRNIALAWEIKIPPINKIIEFNNWSLDFFKKIESNQEQIQILTQLRDTLLPKLMSGEIKVTD